MTPGPVEARDGRQSSGHGGWLEPADVLHPAQEQLEVVALGVQRRELPVLAPAQEDPQVRLGVLTRGAAVVRQTATVARSSSPDCATEASAAAMPSECATLVKSAIRQSSDGMRQKRTFKRISSDPSPRCRRTRRTMRSRRSSPAGCNDGTHRPVYVDL